MEDNRVHAKPKHLTGHETWMKAKRKVSKKDKTKTMAWVYSDMMKTSFKNK